MRKKFHWIFVTFVTATNSGIHSFTRFSAVCKCKRTKGKTTTQLNPSYKSCRILFSVQWSIYTLCQWIFLALERHLTKQMFTTKLNLLSAIICFFTLQRQIGDMICWIVSIGTQFAQTFSWSAEFDVAFLFISLFKYGEWWKSGRKKWMTKVTEDHNKW